jgi:hypothetical protein
VRRERLHDLKLLFEREGLDIFPIGEFVPGTGIELVKRDGTRQEIAARGWNHFRQERHRDFFVPS